MKIYTKTGDCGDTSLTGGSRAPKDSARVEAYGTVDELISQLGMLRCYVPVGECGAMLRSIQCCLMTCAAILSAGDNVRKKLPSITSADVLKLESAIDAMQESLPPLKAFVLPAPPAASAVCHVARCICRRAERCAVTAAREAPACGGVIGYLNRLSDYLFVLARTLAAGSGAGDDCWLPEV